MLRTLSHFFHVISRRERSRCFQTRPAVLMHRFPIFNCTVVRNVSSAADNDSAGQKIPTMSQSSSNLSSFTKTSH